MELLKSENDATVRCHCHIIFTF